MDDLTKEYLEESREGLDRMERCLTELERRPDSAELVAEIFRVVHTIKGGTGYLGFARLEALAHTGENLLGSLRSGRIAATEELINGLLALLDGLRGIVRLIETTGSEGQRSTDDDIELIGRLVELNVVSPSWPEVTEKKDSSCDGVASAPVQREELHDGTQRCAGLPPKCGAGPAGDTQLDGADSAERRASVDVGDKSLRVDVDVLNRMMNLVGELVLTRNRILQAGAGAEDFAELARRLDGVTSDLRETVMQARTQPVGLLFAKFPRLVRDLAQICGRRVRLEYEGQGTGLDKSLIEAIRDPLIHAVRNAVDHGIESPEVRRRAGKNPEGVLRLRAFHHNGSVTIELSDDGAGISPERVLAKALERGIVTAEQAGAMSHREAIQLVFAAGFSTAEQVTSVSGRGVGLDVVRTNVEKVGGSVALESREGLGTTLRMRVPLTLAIIPALVVRSGAQSFALPQSSLVELVYVPADEVARRIEQIGSAEVYRLRERLLPLLRLHRVLKLAPDANADGGGGITIAVVEGSGCRYGLVVDELLAPEEIVVKPMSAALRRTAVFAGATVLGSGTLALILDVGGLAENAEVKPDDRRERPYSMPATAAEGLKVADELSLVVYETFCDAKGARVAERRAISVSAVERIERVARDEVEYANGEAMLRYRGDVLALEDDGGVLRRQGEDVLTVLICMRPAQQGYVRAAVVVDRVTDVSSRIAGAECESGIAVVDGRITTIEEGVPAGNPACLLGEVA